MRLHFKNSQSLQNLLHIKKVESQKILKTGIFLNLFKVDIEKSINHHFSREKKSEI